MKTVTEMLHVFDKLLGPLPTRLRSMCTNEVLLDPKFQVSPGGKTRHHQYRHGLMEHTLDVLQNASKMCMDTPTWETVAVAAVFHDYAKVYEYDLEVDPKNPEKGEIVVKLPYHNLIRHVVGSYTYFWHKSWQYELEDWRRLEIGHCILAHHGRKEWGSPIEPQTMAAYILHSADMLSFQANDTTRGKDKA